MARQGLAGDGRRAELWAGALPEAPGADGADILRALGFADDEIGRLVKSGSMKSAGGG